MHIAYNFFYIQAELEQRRQLSVKELVSVD